MPRFAANLTMMFTEVDFLQRFGSAARAGFQAVEYLFPYDYDPRQLRDALREHGLVQVLHNLPAGDWTAGERGIACDPDRADEFRAGVDRAIRYAEALECPQLNCLAGIPPSGVSSAAARATLVENLRFAAGRLEKAGIKLLIEPINTRDIPGFFLNRTEQALAILDDVASDNVFLQYDVYHMQVMEGDLTTRLQRHLPRIAHIQIADPPGRHEPGSGEINFSYLLTLLDRMGYTGWIGCEYKPAGSTEAGLAWMSAWNATRV